MTTATTAERHPLLKKKIVGISTWEEWLKRWSAVKTAEELISLLHYGFNAGGSVYRDTHAKALFYLSVANGYSDYSGIGSRSDDVKGNYRSDGILTAIPKPVSEYYSSSDLRHLVAQKAWEVLCVTFFGGWVVKQGSQASPGWFKWWGDNEQDPELIRTLFMFFDPRDGANNFEYRDIHYRTLVERFLRDFITTAWKTSIGSRGHWWSAKPYSEDEGAYRDIATLCEASRPRLINMIVALGWERMLLRLPFDERTIPHLMGTDTDAEIKERASQGNTRAEVILLLRNKLEVLEKERTKK